MLTLYSTSGCHLCEQAYQLIEQLSLQEMTQVVDIALDDSLFSRYGVTIPVLSIQTNDNTNGQISSSDSSDLAITDELLWPFNLEQLQAWLENNGINYHS